MLNRFFAAVRFLTILPVPGRHGDDDTALAGSLPFFPVVGLLVGGLAAGLAAILEFFFPPLLTAVLLVAVLLAVSGGLHMDGLGDTADGLFSSRPREEMLAIMRDSRTGAMGVMAIVLVLVARIAALAALTGPVLRVAVLLMPLAGRAVLVLLIACLPYARPQGGLATLFYQAPSRIAAGWACLILAFSAWLAAGPAGVITAAAVLMIIAVLAVFFFRRLGGVTGDTLGAACEVAETAVAVFLTVHIMPPA